jgi:hypothetical protein
MVQHSISPPKSAVDCLQQVFPCFMVQENELGPFSRVLIEFESQRQGKHCLDSGFGPWMVVGLLPPWSDNRNILLWGSHFAPKLVGTRLHRIYTALILQHRASSSSDTEAEAIKWHYCERFAVLGGVRSTAIIFRLGFPPPHAFCSKKEELGPFSRVLIEFESQRQGKHCLDSEFGPWMVVGLLPPWSDNRNILLWGSHLHQSWSGQGYVAFTPH